MFEIISITSIAIAITIGFFVWFFTKVANCPRCQNTDPACIVCGPE